MKRNRNKKKSNQKNRKKEVRHHHLIQNLSHPRKMKGKIKIKGIQGKVIKEMKKIIKLQNNQLKTDPFLNQDLDHQKNNQKENESDIYVSYVYEI
jgi:hypothetical protein